MDYNYFKHIADYIRNKINDEPEVAIILGSGLGSLTCEVKNKIVIPYSEIPNMPKVTVTGHSGEFVFGEIENKKVILMAGRFHLYEGHKAEVLKVLPYVCKLLGAKVFVVTNAAGGVNLDFEPGDLMIIKDHINYSFSNSMMGENIDEMGPRFFDMSEAYSKRLIEILKDSGREKNISLREGVYLMYSGPNYETPSEIKAFRILGADAVGMSTVPEVLAARHCSMEIAGISCITNMAAGILPQPLSHGEVIETSNKVKNKFIDLMKTFIGRI